MTVDSKKQFCTACRIEEVYVSLKDGRNLCEDCTEDWLQEEWENCGGGWEL